MINMHFKQTAKQQMAGNVECQVGTKAMVDHGMRSGNWRVMLLECGCTVRLIQEPTMKDSHLAVKWSAHGVMVTKATIQISEGAIFHYRKKTGSLSNSSYSF